MDNNGFPDNGNGHALTNLLLGGLAVGNGFPGNQAQGNVFPGNQAQGNGFPGNQAQGNGFNGNQAQGNGIPGNQAQGNGFPGNQDLGNGFNGNQAQGNGLPGNQAHGNGFLGNQALGNGFPGNQALGNEFPGNHAILANGFHDGAALLNLGAMGNGNEALQIMQDPCVACKYEGRECRQSCIFRSYFNGQSEDMEDFARCVAVYGKNMTDELIALPRRYQHSILICLKIRAWRTFERRRSQAYDEILINLRKRYPWGWLIDPNPIENPWDLLPCMVCVTERRNRCPQGCIFSAFFPNGRQAENNFNNCLKAYGQDAADFLSGDHTDRTRQQQRIMLLTRCARPLGDGSSYADDESFVADLLNKYIDGADAANLDGGGQERDEETDGGSLFTNLNINFWFFFLISSTVICGVVVKRR